MNSQLEKHYSEDKSEMYGISTNLNIILQYIEFLFGFIECKKTLKIYFYLFYLKKKKKKKENNYKTVFNYNLKRPFGFSVVKKL